MEKLQIIEPQTHDLGGFTVGRLLPRASLRSVGPFVFFDHIGPATLAADRPIAVRPHPHIGLATVTYLWEGSMMHRDSLGSVQEIHPGDVNWMTAGRGIVHSERTPERLLGTAQRFHGLQTWVALPREFEEAEPAFVHHPRASLPVVERPGVTLTVVAGHAFGVRSPVAVLVDTLYVSIDVQAGRSVHIPTEHVERALFPVVGELEVEGVALPLGSLALLGPGEVVLTARSDARVMLVGGAPLDGPRHMFWNFVHSSRERIEQAKEDWRAGRFAAVPGETEFIPLP